MCSDKSIDGSIRSPRSRQTPPPVDLRSRRSAQPSVLAAVSPCSRQLPQPSPLAAVSPGRPSSRSLRAGIITPHHTVARRGEVFRRPDMTVRPGCSRPVAETINNQGSLAGLHQLSAGHAEPILGPLSGGAFTHPQLLDITALWIRPRMAQSTIDYPPATFNPPLRCRVSHG